MQLKLRTLFLIMSFAAVVCWLFVQYGSECDLDVMSLAPSKDTSELDWFLQYDKTGIRSVVILPRSSDENNYRHLVQVSRTHWFYGGRRVVLKGRTVELRKGFINLQIIHSNLKEKQIWINSRDFPQSVMTQAIDEETVAKLVDLAR